MLDSTRIAVRPVPGELQVYKGASWARTPVEMLEDGVLRTLEDSGRIPAVARQGSGMSADYRLLMDLRHFEADYAAGATPAAVLEVSTKLLHAQDKSAGQRPGARRRAPGRQPLTASRRGDLPHPVQTGENRGIHRGARA